MPKRPGGKYKGKIQRAKGESTIAAELEAKKRKAYEANLARLQERRQQELLAAQGLQSEEDAAQARALAKLAQLFGKGKSATLKKFWKNWKLGIINIKKDKALEERQTCWRKSCEFCGDPNVKELHPEGHKQTCRHWWKFNLGRQNVGQERDPLAAEMDRDPDVNRRRSCHCCKADTGLPALGCRASFRLKDVGFMRPSDAERLLAAKEAASRITHIPPSPMFSPFKSASSPTLRKWQPPMTLEVEKNVHQLRDSNRAPDGVPVYDPSCAFNLNEKQIRDEERRKWTDELTSMAGSPKHRQRAGTLPALTYWEDISPAPDYAESGKPLQETVHWRTGQKTMLDKYMMKMYVVGTQHCLE